MPSPGPRGLGGGPRSTLSSATSPRTSQSPDPKRSSMSFVDFVAARCAYNRIVETTGGSVRFMPPTVAVQVNPQAGVGRVCVLNVVPYVVV